MTATDLAVVLFETATLRSGYQLPDTKEYGDRIERMLRLSMNIDLNAQVNHQICKSILLTSFDTTLSLKFNFSSIQSRYLVICQHCLKLLVTFKLIHLTVIVLEHLLICQFSIVLHCTLKKTELLYPLQVEEYEEIADDEQEEGKDDEAKEEDAEESEETDETEEQTEVGFVHISLNLWVHDLDESL